MIKNVVTGVVIVLVIFLLFRNCGKSDQIAYLEGQLALKEQALEDITKSWEAAHKAWAATEAYYKAKKIELEAIIATHQGHIDSLTHHLDELETSYTQLEQSGASCAQLLANMTLQRDAWRTKSSEWEDSYKQEHVLRLGLEVSYTALLAEQAASDRRYAALEDVCTTLRKELKVAKKANLGLGLQAQALKVVVTAAAVFVGLKFAKVI